MWHIKELVRDTSRLFISSPIASQAPSSATTATTPYT
jgi:hypothetical protein